jgi:hypothetical protein
MNEQAAEKLSSPSNEKNRFYVSDGENQQENKSLETMKFSKRKMSSVHAMFRKVLTG